MRCSSVTLAAVLSLGCPADEAAETSAVEVVSSAQDATRPELPRSLAHSVDAYVTQWGRHWPSFRFQGVAMIADGGEPTFTRAYGHRDLARELPHGPRSRFSVGTLSAHLTAATLLRLSEQGSVDLGATIDRYLPEFEHGQRITVEHLLTHTAGLPSFTDEDPFSGTSGAWKRLRGEDHQGLLDLFDGADLQFDPGVDFAPSNSNYAVLGRIIEVVTEHPYEHAVAAQVLEPLGMSETTFGEVDHMHAIGLHFVETGDAGAHLEPVTGYRPRSGGAALGWIATAQDLGKLYHGLSDPDFVSANSRDRMLGQNPLSTPYAMAPVTVADRSAYAWKGFFEGHNSAVLWIPSEDRVFIALGNSEVVPGDAITTNLAHLAYGEDSEAREESRPIPEGSGAIGRYERLRGMWTLTGRARRLLQANVDHEVVERLMFARVSSQGEHATLHMGAGARRFYPLGSHRYFFKDRPQSRARFVQAPSASDDRLVLIRDGVEIRYHRVPDKMATRAPELTRLRGGPLRSGGP